MRFTKMHGIGNDYIYVNALEETVEDPSRAARVLSDRHFGIGSDGLILICPSDQADFRMEMYNADGSRGKMCGNGIRCVGKYVYDHHLTDKTTVRIETDSGIKELLLTVRGGKAVLARVNMGKPVFAPSEIPAALQYEPLLADYTALDELMDIPLMVRGEIWKVSCVSMGNPHCIVPVDDPVKIDLERMGPFFEHHPFFPEQVNTEFIRIDDRKHITMRVWERGAGETLACGTGACAVAVACIERGLTENSVTVHLRGGDLQIDWDKAGDVFMTGPATTVYEGVVSWPVTQDM